ncbi:MAG: hypothetical protein ACRDJU_14910 [Actinomycetota bacterium]
MIPEVTLTAKTFADLSGWRKISLTGSNAVIWLNAQVTTDVSWLRPGSSQRCLLLDDAGGLQADFTAAVSGSSILLIQDPAQRESVADLLRPLAGGTDVDLEERSTELAILAFPTRPAAPDLGGTSFYSPSTLGPGADIVCLAEDRRRLAGSLAKTFTFAGPDDLEAWRIAAGRARLGVDARVGDWPAEVGFDAVVDLTKAGFRGREAVYRRPASTPLRTSVVALSAPEPVSPGDLLMVDGTAVGELTSVTGTEEGIAALGRVRWPKRGGPFSTDSGVGLELREVP